MAEAKRPWPTYKSLWKQNERLHAAYDRLDVANKDMEEKLGNLVGAVVHNFTNCVNWPPEDYVKPECEECKFCEACQEVREFAGDSP